MVNKYNYSCCGKIILLIRKTIVSNTFMKFKYKM